MNPTPNGWSLALRDHFGMSAECEIVVALERDGVEATALLMLQRLLQMADVESKIVMSSASAGCARILLGRDAHHALITRMGDAGEIDIRDVAAEDDGFHLKQVGQDIVIAGANSRGVLYGVFELEAYLRAGADGPLDIRKIPYFRKRGSGLHYSFNPHVALIDEDRLAEKVEYLARLGINQLSDQGICGDIQRLVHSEVFPFETPPDPAYQRQVKQLSALCRQFGIEHYIWLQMPNLAVDASCYPAEALGKVKRPWGGDQDGMDVTLCVNSPLVQRHLRNMMRQLARDYPDVAGVLLYNMDGSHWLCTPQYCERCRMACTDSPPDTFTPWETQARLVSVLADAAHEENPDFTLMLWGAVHYHGENFAKMIRATRGYGRLLANWNASDRSVMIPAVAERDPAFTLSQEICAERGIPFHAIFEFNNLESVPRSLPFPFHVCDALQRFDRWGVRNLTEIYGLVPEHNSINALVMQAFQGDPRQQPEALLAELALRQFGTVAAKGMYRAWEEMRAAFDAWHDLPFGPLDGSQHILSIGTSVWLPPFLFPEGATGPDRFGRALLDYNWTILTNVEPWRAAEYRNFKEPAFVDRMAQMAQHLARAVDHAKEAVLHASDQECIEICHFDGGDGRPTRKAYAELNWAAIAVAEHICRQRVDMLRAYQLLTALETRPAGEDADADALQARYRELLRDHIVQAERFVTLLTELRAMHPCLTRTGMPEREIDAHLATTCQKIVQLQDYLQEIQN